MTIDENTVWRLHPDQRRCPGRAGCKGKVITRWDPAARVLHLTCNKCGTTYADGRFVRYLDYRACKDCGYVRRVTISIGSQPGFLGADEHGHYWKAYCDCCQCDRAALSHLHQFQAMAKKAKAMRAARDAKKGGK